jgi:DNA-binding HxlR family transcriptional regulator
MQKLEMIKTPSKPRSSCPINFGLEIFGDKWTLLILRDILLVDKKTFKEFQASDEGIASNVLSDRLQRLTKCGLISKLASPGDGRQIHYAMTEAGRKLLPVLVEMSYWGATHDPKTGAPKAFVTAYERNREQLLQALASGFDPTKG